VGDDVFPVEFEAHAGGLGDGEGALVVKGGLGVVLNGLLE